MNHFKALGIFISETVRFIDEDIIVFICSILYDLVKFAERFYLCFLDSKVKKCFFPVVLEYRRTYNQLAPGQMLSQHCGYKCLPQTDDIGQKHSIVSIQDFFGGDNRLFLIFKFHKTFRQVQLDLLIQIDIFLQVFVEHFQI